MRIVDICEFYSPTGGGVKRYVDQKLGFAPRFGHDITIIAPGTHTHVEDRVGGRIHWVKAPLLPLDANYRMFWGASEVWRILDGLAPDLIEGSSPWRGGWLAARWPGLKGSAKAPRMLFLHSDPVSVYPQTFLGGWLGTERVDRMFGWFWNYMRRLNACYDGAIVTNPVMAERFASFGLKNIEVAPFGVARENFGAGARNMVLREQMLATCGLGPDASLLVAVGRHHPEKRIPMLIEAVRIAQKSRPIGLVIVGDGFMRKQIERHAARVPHVRVVGKITDSNQLCTVMASADALIHGSAAETFGLVLAEALCSGTPLIVPEGGASGSFAAPGHAETYPAGDAAGAAAAILRLLARDRVVLSAASAKAADETVLTVEQHFEKLFAIYERVVRSSR